MKEEIKAFRWNGDSLSILDQRKLPTQEVWISCKDYRCIAKAIKDMAIRGAPAIGVVAAYAVVLAAREIARKTGDFLEFKTELKSAMDVLSATRPTAVNLFWAIKRMERIVDAGMNTESICMAVESEAKNIEAEDVENNKNIGKLGAELLSSKEVILTHCNTGALATAGYGTALGVIRAAVEMGKDITVFVDETRPYLQGARLTAWELGKENIPYYIITDSMAGWFMSLGKITWIVVGADRIARNGDTANKIGTYSLSVLAKENGIPFYIAAPTSTFDANIDNGKVIPIEERNQDEVLYCYCKDCRTSPLNAKAKNPAFDVTPHENITGIITEKAVISPPNEESIANILST